MPTVYTIWTHTPHGEQTGHDWDVESGQRVRFLQEGPLLVMQLLDPARKGNQVVFVRRWPLVNVARIDQRGDF